MSFAIETYLWLKPGQFINFLIFLVLGERSLPVPPGYTPVRLYRIFICGGLSPPPAMMTRRHCEPLTYPPVRLYITIYSYPFVFLHLINPFSVCAVFTFLVKLVKYEYSYSLYSYTGSQIWRMINDYYNHLHTLACDSTLSRIRSLSEDWIW